MVPAPREGGREGGKGVEDEEEDGKEYVVGEGWPWQKQQGRREGGREEGKVVDM